MIPKLIHYCWFGRKALPQSALNCIESWKKYFPDYEIVEWNEDNFDVNIIPYTREAYAVKKYAFVSDYARFWILYNYGGLYFDTDVEVIRNMDDIVNLGPFMGREAGAYIMCGGNAIAPGLGLGVTPGHHFYGEMLVKYSNLHFITDGIINETTIVKYTSELLNKYPVYKISEDVDCIDEIYIYSPEYFCPLDYNTGEMKITKNTRTIHYYSATWKTTTQKYKKKLIKTLGPILTSWIVFVKQKIIKIFR